MITAFIKLKNNSMKAINHSKLQLMSDKYISWQIKHANNL